jgi:hypothetical protein
LLLHPNTDHCGPQLHSMIVEVTLNSCVVGKPQVTQALPMRRAGGLPPRWPLTFPWVIGEILDRLRFEGRGTHGVFDGEVGEIAHSNELAPNQIVAEAVLAL